MLNPFLLLVYLIDLVDEMSAQDFARAMIRSALIGTACYLVFSLLGDSIFDTVFQANFASFKIFGGVVFLITGVRFVFEGSKAMKTLKGEPGQVSGGIILPILVGPGTISASIVVGQQLEPVPAVIAIVLAVMVCIGVLIILKKIYGTVKSKQEDLLLRYVDIIGRVSALLIGTYAVEMIMSGIQSWFQIS